MTVSLAVRCPAKVNLTLEVLGRRPDGYHELRTVFQAISLADELVLVRDRAADPLVVSGFATPVADNLCLQALAAFRELRPVPDDLVLRLHKRIPVGAGLGGGSSDAAGVLVALDRWFGPVGDEALRQLASALGSDVAFFRHGGTMLGQGRGEVLSALPSLPPTWLVVAWPQQHLSTREAYAALRPEDFTAGAHTTALVRALETGCGLRELAEGMYNVFERPVLKLCPQIAQAKHGLLRAGSQAALLSGSGAAVFGVFPGAASAQRAALELRQAGLWATAAVTISGGVEVAEAT
ncbi:MAG: 4-(cytidine 5'-diphospho)-2-C-methyl-D-erythritol kinase [Armatimonadetes bacterium]|nr:4-(cytidine 5'-diphospho)-2-C-methyl-D-erythritol kinase [Armatimonadota bacterium]